MNLLKFGWNAGTGSLTVLTLFVICLLSSCDPDCSSCGMEEGKPSTLTIELLSDVTKTTLAQTNDQDNAINSIDVFIFRNNDTNSPDYQKLDTYQRFEGDALQNLQITTTTGSRTICVIANSNISSYQSIINLDAFRTLIADLKAETLGDFTMYGETNADLGVSTNVSILLKRFVARVGVTSIKTSFSGPYSGMHLDECRLYLVNAQAAKLIYNGNQPQTPVILNETTLVPEDVNSTAESGMIMDFISAHIDDAGYSTPHYFYCYANETENLEQCTKLILQANLDGCTYYYPIPINQKDYGYSADNGHFGIRRNTQYSYGITITRPGSMDPNEPVVPGTVVIDKIQVEGWNIIPEFNKTF